MAGGRFRELLKKYGKVALGVHFSVSAASVTGLYVAISNNVDVESLFEKVGMTALSTSKQTETNSEEGLIIEDKLQDQLQTQPKTRNRTAELAASSGGALAVAILCNKALFPIRVPITIALTPPIARFLARRRIIKTGVRVMTRKVCEPLEEDSFRPILHHYDGPKFRLELNIPEAISLLDIFEESDA